MTGAIPAPLVRVYRLARIELGVDYVRMTNRTYDSRRPLSPAQVERWHYFMTEVWQGYAP